MNIDEFISVIDANRELLGNPKKGEDFGCPLRVAMLVNFGCPCIDCWIELYHGKPGQREPINPDPESASDFLGMDEEFTRAVADAWDDGNLWWAEDFNTTFAGFLIGVSLRPAPLQLTA